MLTADLLELANIIKAVCYRTYFYSPPEMDQLLHVGGCHTSLRALEKQRPIRHKLVETHELGDFHTPSNDLCGLDVTSNGDPNLDLSKLFILETSP